MLKKIENFQTWPECRSIRTIAKTTDFNKTFCSAESVSQICFQEVHVMHDKNHP